ncbi:MAG TPA: hypothetical protein PLI96_07965 [Halothiobacillus sp.]|nr:hypothetical protein [Halothiobacillus sp.]
MSGLVGEMPELQVNQYKPPNLLGMASDAAQLQSQVNQNRLFSSQQQQNQLLTKNTNADGSINVPGYQAAIANTPGAQIGAADAFKQANELNSQVLQNTGLTMQQHFARLKALADGVVPLLLNAPQNGGVPAADFKSAILSAFKDGTINASEAAQEMAQVSPDPKANFQRVQQLDSSVSNGIQALAPHLITLSTGSGTVTGQDNPYAPGGAYVPNIVNGVPQSQLVTPTSYTNANNQTVNTTLGGYAGAVGQPTAPVIGGGIAGGAPQQPQQPSGPLPVIGTPNAPAQAQPATLGAIMGPAPGVVDVQKNNVDSYNSDVQAATNIAPQVSSLTEILAEAPSAMTGPESGKTAYLSGIASQFGLSNGNTATAEQIVAKGTAMLSGQSLSNTGPNTDAGLMNAIGATPGAHMTLGAVQATGAMVLGTKLYQQRLGQLAQQKYGATGSPTDYLLFKQQYQQNTSPLIQSLPYMPAPQRQALLSYFKTLPTADQTRLNDQYKFAQKQGWLTAQAPNAPAAAPGQ